MYWGPYFSHGPQTAVGELISSVCLVLALWDKICRQLQVSSLALPTSWLRDQGQLGCMYQELSANMRSPHTHLLTGAKHFGQAGPWSV